MPLFRLRQIDYVLVIYRPPLGICIPLHASQVSVSHVISYLPVLGVSASMKYQLNPVEGYLIRSR